MAYVAPSGWIERRDDQDDLEWGGGVRVRFHLREDCDRITRPADLTPVQRPYSATRCPACAAV